MKQREVLDHLRLIEPPNRRDEQADHGEADRSEAVEQDEGRYADLLGRRYGDQLDARAERYIAGITGGAERMRGLIDDLLAYSRAGRRELDMKPVDMGTLLDGVRADLTVAIREAKAEVVVEDELPTVVADQSQIRMVLRNLLANAIKFHGEDPPLSRAVEFYSALATLSESGMQEARTKLGALAGRTPNDQQLQLAYAQMLTYGLDTRAEGIERLQRLAQQAPGPREILAMATAARELTGALATLDPPAAAHATTTASRPLAGDTAAPSAGAGGEGTRTGRAGQ